MEELASRPRDAFLFFTQFLIFYLSTIIPLWIFRIAPMTVLGAFYFAATLNTSGFSQFISLITRKIGSGEYEAYMLTPTSTFSLYLSNLYTIWMMIPVFLLAYLPGVLETGQLSLNFPLFMLAFLLTILSNASISIVLTGVHIAYKPLRQLQGLIGIMLYLFCIFGVLTLLDVSPWNSIILTLPWTHSTLLTVQSLSVFTSPISPIYNIIYLATFTIISVPISLKVYKRAERTAKKYGLADLRP